LSNAPIAHGNICSLDPVLLKLLLDLDRFSIYKVDTGPYEDIPRWYIGQAITAQYLVQQ
jgi:hypothetical protein